jgi:D-glucuronyl C5-epimerase C-terminus
VAVPASPGHAAGVYQPQNVAVGRRPYEGSTKLPKHNTGTTDGTGVQMFLRNGVLVDHPVRQAQYGLALLNTYRLTHQTWFLTMAERQGLRLLNRKVVARGAWWYPYPFAFPLGAGIGGAMTPPWYSAMAQGQALSLFVRLGEVTGEAGWSAAADATFASLTLGYSATDPWVTWSDATNHRWLEEYPNQTTAASGRVLNGHLFAVFGVWDYWRTTHSAAAAALFSAALQTVQANLLTGFRNPQWVSNYSLRGRVPSEKYHAIHINQLLQMHALTGDPVFATDAEVLQQDFPAPAQSATVRFAARTHIGVRFTSVNSGRVTTRKTVRLLGVSTAPVDQRRRIHGQPGYWFHVTKGALAGYWVQEQAGARAVPGPVAVLVYAATRTVRLAPGTYTAYTATSHRSMVIRGGSAAPVGAFGWVGGRLSVEITAGALRRYWLPVGGGASL